MQYVIGDVDRLYKLYLRHIDLLRVDVIRVNRQLGSDAPETMRLCVLSRTDFEGLLQRRGPGSDVVHRFLITLQRQEASRKW